MQVPSHSNSPFLLPQYMPMLLEQVGGGGGGGVGGGGAKDSIPQHPGILLYINKITRDEIF